VKITVDYENKRIIMSRKFAKLAAIVGSREYSILQACKNEKDGYEVIIKKIKKSRTKESYKGLSYCFIERYIASHKDSGVHLPVYKELRRRGMKYPYIKRWFLTTYPDFSMDLLAAFSSDEGNVYES